MNFMCLHLICLQVTYVCHLWGLSLEGLVYFLPLKESLLENSSSWPRTSGPRDVVFICFTHPRAFLCFLTRLRNCFEKEF